MSLHTVEARLNGFGVAMALVCIGYLVSRVFLGIDFTDEMQHYGELASLVTTGKLFQVDLFLQQAMYAFLYPVFRLYYLMAGGWDYLVIAGRLFMLCAYVAAAWLAYRRSVMGASRYPGWAAASLVLAWLPFNILSPYYNAIAGLLISLIVFLWAGAARARGYLVLSALAVSMLCVSYPTLGLAVGFLLVGDELLVRRYRLAAQMVGLLVVFGGVWGAVLWGMTDSLGDIQDAVAFSKDFSVGYAFSHPRHLFILCAIVSMGLVFAYFGVKCEPEGRARGGRVLLVLGVLLSWWLVGRQGWLLVSLLYLAALFLLRFLSPGVREKSQAARLGVFGLLIGAVSALTSGNGVINVAIGLGAVLPYLVGLILRGGVLSALRSGDGKTQALHPVQVAVTFALLLVVNNALHPYREEPVWNLTHSLETVPAFRGISSSREKLAAVEFVQKLVGTPGALQGKSLLVVGQQPWIYFALNAVPRTPMLFMHYSGGEAATRIVAKRLSRQTRPDMILVMNHPPAEIMGVLDQVLGSGYRCDSVVPPTLPGDPDGGMGNLGFDTGMKLCRLSEQYES